MTYVCSYTVAITYRWKSVYTNSFKYQTTVVTVDAHSREVAVARAMNELIVSSEVYVTEVEITNQSDGWNEYE